MEISEAGLFRATIQARLGDWFSVVIRDDAGPTLLTGAIYTEARSP